MNWEAIGSVGEIVGAILIIATLLFLGRQMGQQSRADTATTTGSWLTDYNAMVLEILRDPDIAELVRQGFTDFEELTPNNQMRFHCWMVPHLLSAQVMYFQFVDGIMHERMAEQILPFNAMMLKTKGGLYWWSTARGIWRPEFVQYMDDLIANSEPVTEIWPWFSITGSETRQ
jgi:hypothetical protein